MLPKNLVPIITPFTGSDLKIDFDSMLKQVEFLVSKGINGLILGGTTGESISLSNQERKEIIQVTAKSYPNLSLVGCVFAWDWPGLVGMIDAFSGCRGLLVLPPMFIRPGRDDILDYYSTITKLSPLPIILYNNPSRTKVDISDLYEELTKLKQVIGVKETDFTNKHSVNVWCGEDSQATQVKCYGMISALANLLPAIANKIAEHTNTQDETQYWNNICNIMNNYVNPLPIKYLLHRLNIISSPETRFAIKLRNTDELDQLLGYLRQ